MAVEDQYRDERLRMVERQIAARGIKDPRVLDAMRAIPRHIFVPPSHRSAAYGDHPLPIGEGQTISQPYIVALMTSLLDLRGDETVLEIGTGSGYQAAILAETAARVCTVEVIPELSAGARALLEERLGYRNILFKVGRGQEGWPEHAPFDRILLTAAPVEFPRGLFDQLGEGGIALAPVGVDGQCLIRYHKKDGTIRADELIGVIFVPLV